jgi:hypothetical protein
MAHVKIPMAIEEDAGERLGEVVSSVDGGVHTAKNNQISCPIALRYLMPIRFSSSA